MNRQFADTVINYSGYEKFAIFGAPFDKTYSFKPGAIRGPGAIRDSSYNFETFMFQHGTDMTDIPVWDAGDIDEHNIPENAVEDVYFLSSDILNKNIIPIMMGGEHSLSFGMVKALKEKYDDFKLIIIDAHLDFRDEYLGMKNSHACFCRRASEIIGTENILTVGVRSICKEEFDEAISSNLKFISSFEILDNEKSITDIKEFAAHSPVYLSIDIDGIDPAYAPGTGTPEPFGLTSLFVKNLIDVLDTNIVAMDIMEVAPSGYDDITPFLAARLIREFISVKWKRING